MRGIGRQHPEGRRLRPRWRRPLRDRGGAATILSAVLGAGALFGFGAVVVDVGQIYTEREQLQSGADSAAEAVARLCASGACPTGVDPLALARTRAGQNAKDGTSNVELCGAGITGLVACPPYPVSSGTLTRCMGTAPARYVEVRTTTRNGDASTLLPPSMARELAGNGGYDGVTVRACARASLTPGGNVTGGATVALTVHKCYWELFTTSGHAYPQPPYDVADERVLYIKDSRALANGTECDDGNAASPGNWGWLDDDQDGDDDCRATFTAGSEVGGEPGNGNRRDCADLLRSLRDSGQPLMLPLYDTVSGQGNNTRFHIAGFGAFIVTGFFLTGGGNSEESNLLHGHYCGNPSRCIYGYFVGAAFGSGVTSSSGTGTNYGATVTPAVRLVG